VVEAPRPVPGGRPVGGVQILIGRWGWLEVYPQEICTQAAGELMLVHLCIDCGKVSLNRFAAMMTSIRCGYSPSPSGQAGQILTLVQESGVNPLDLTASDLVRAQLFGRRWDLVIQGNAVA